MQIAADAAALDEIQQRGGFLREEVTEDDILAMIIAGKKPEHLAA